MLDLLDIEQRLQRFWDRRAQALVAPEGNRGQKLTKKQAAMVREWGRKKLKLRTMRARLREQGVIVARSTIYAVLNGDTYRDVK